MAARKTKEPWLSESSAEYDRPFPDDNTLPFPDDNTLFPTVGYGRSYPNSTRGEIRTSWGGIEKIEKDDLPRVSGRNWDFIREW